MNNKSTNSTKSQKQERTKKSEDLWSEDDLVHQAFSNRVGGWYIHIGKEDLMLFICVSTLVAFPQLRWHVSTWWISDF
jgi:hypothetical protein